MAVTFSDPYQPAVTSLDRDELKRWQFKELKRALWWAYNNSEFYRLRFRDAGITPDDIETPDDFAEKVPMVTKRDFLEDQKDRPPYGRRLAVPEEEIVQVRLTSGTSGIGQEVYALAREDVELSGRGWIIHFSTMGLQRGDVSVLTLPVATMAAAHDVIEACRFLGINLFLLGIYDTDTKLKFMTMFPPQHIVASPTYLLRLTITCQEKGIDPKVAFPRLKAITLLAEPYPEKWVEDMQRFWGCTLHEMYGSTQSGTLLACTCRNGALGPNGRGSLHLMEHLTYVEVINPETGKQAKYGEEGEIVITPLFRRATPVIRFRTGDKVVYYPHTACQCGSSFDFLYAGTIARYDDMIKIKGMNVWPQAVDETVFAFDEVEEYSGIVGVDEQGREFVEIKVEFRKEVPDGRRREIEQLLTEQLRQKTQVSMAVKEVPYGTLPRATFKSRRWTDNRLTGLQRVTFTEKPA